MKNTLNRLDSFIEGDLIRSVWVAFLEALARFWNNRFVIEHRELDILKMELDRERIEKNKLLDSILEHLNPKNENEPEINLAEMKPLGKSNWRARAKQLEDESRKLKAASTPQVATVRKPSIEELELELGVADA